MHEKKTEQILYNGKYNFSGIQKKISYHPIPLDVFVIHVIQNNRCVRYTCYS